MKRLKLLIVMLALSLVTGCSGESTIDKEAAKQLDESLEVADFLLDGKVYTMPCSLNTFINNGWTLDDVSKPEDTIVGVKTEGQFTARHASYDTYLTLSFYNDTEKEISLMDNGILVHIVKIQKPNDDNPKLADVVIKGGITELTSQEDAEEIMETLNKDEKTSQISQSNKDTIKDSKLRKVITLSYKDNEIKSFEFGNIVGKRGYRKFETPEQREKDIKKTKETIQEDWKEYQGNYSKIINKLKQSQTNYKTTNIAIYTEVTLYKKGMSNRFNSLYIAKDKDGNIFVIDIPRSETDRIVWPQDVKVGDKLTIWGYIKKPIQMSTNKDDIAPIISPSIVERNQKMIYLK